METATNRIVSQHLWSQQLQWVTVSTPNSPRFQCVFEFKPILSLQAFIHHCRRIWTQATATAPIYQAAQKVWLSPQDRLVREKCKKLAPKFIRPFAIQEVINPAKVWLVTPVHESAFDFKVKPVCESSLLPTAPPPPLCPGSSKGVLPITSAASFVLVIVGGVFSTCSIRRGMVQLFQHHLDQQSKPSTFTRGTTHATLPSPSPITNHNEDNMNLPRMRHTMKRWRWPPPASSLTIPLLFHSLAHWPGFPCLILRTETKPVKTLKLTIYLNCATTYCICLLLIQLKPEIKITLCNL